VFKNVERMKKTLFAGASYFHCRVQSETQGSLAAGEGRRDSTDKKQTERKDEVSGGSAGNERKALDLVRKK